MHPGKCSFRWAGRRRLMRELGARGLGFYGALTYSRLTTEDRRAQSHCPGMQLLRRRDSWGLWMELEARAGVWRGEGQVLPVLTARTWVRSRKLAGLVNHQHPPEKR